jgi:hypothetical protein
VHGVVLEIGEPGARKKTAWKGGKFTFLPMTPKQAIEGIAVVMVSAGQSYTIAGVEEVDSVEETTRKLWLSPILGTGVETPPTNLHHPRPQWTHTRHYSEHALQVYFTILNSNRAEIKNSNFRVLN